MTEDEIKAMEMRVFEDGEEIDIIFELEWTEQQLSEATKALASNKAAFKLHRFLRDEKAMQTNEENLKRVRDVIKYLNKRKEELSKN